MITRTFIWTYNVQALIAYDIYFAINVTRSNAY